MEFYTGLGKKGMPLFKENERLKDASRYIASPALQKAINVAMLLGQPLLLTGASGTGKTQFAHHLADYFDPEGFKDNLFVFNTKSTSKATDLLYQYDALKHFQYIQNNPNPLSPETIESLFIQYQALGAAIKSNRRCIVLIDEIDKAPRDLPNDLLDVLENLAFEIPEIGRVGSDQIKTTSQNRPIVIITSNSEKNLPDAFIRRCVFHHIPFPSDELLTTILQGKISQFSPQQIPIILNHFNRVRKLCKRKSPATAELLQWVAILEQLDYTGDFQVGKLNSVGQLNTLEKEQLQATYGLIVKDKDDLTVVVKDILGIDL